MTLSSPDVCIICIIFSAALRRLPRNQTTFHVCVCMCWAWACFWTWQANELDVCCSTCGTQKPYKHKFNFYNYDVFGPIATDFPQRSSYLCIWCTTFFALLLLLLWFTILQCSAVLRLNVAGQRAYHDICRSKKRKTYTHITSYNQIWHVSETKCSNCFVVLSTWGELKLITKWIFWKPMNRNWLATGP